MKCEKCSSSVSQDSKFCSNCGTEIKKDLSDSFDETVRDCGRVWFIVGFIKGCFSNKKDKKTLKGFEESLKKISSKFWKDYGDTIDYWRNIVVKNNEKETPRPKRKSVPGAETVQKE